MTMRSCVDALFLQPARPRRFCRLVRHRSNAQSNRIHSQIPAENLTNFDHCSKAGKFNSGESTGLDSLIEKERLSLKMTSWIHAEGGRSSPAGWSLPCVRDGTFVEVCKLSISTAQLLTSPGSLRMDNPQRRPRLRNWNSTEHEQTGARHQHRTGSICRARGSEMPIANLPLHSDWLKSPCHGEESSKTENHIQAETLKFSTGKAGSHQQVVRIT